MVEGATFILNKIWKYVEENNTNYYDISIYKFSSHSFILLMSDRNPFAQLLHSFPFISILFSRFNIFFNWIAVYGCGRQFNHKKTEN